MSFDFRLILTTVFFFILTVFVLTHKKGRRMHVWKAVPIFYAVMYRTKFGLKWMDKVGKKYKNLIRYIGYGSIIIGFLGMILISFLLFKNLIPLLTKPEAPSGAGLVLPVKGGGIFEGVIFFVPIEFWIISIFIIALVHEYAHGILARAHDIKVKSSGFAFLGAIVPVIPAAFVEPEEKILQKRPIRQQLSVFAAGPLSNIILGLLCVGLLILVFSPLSAKIVEADGVEITGYVEGDFPAKNSGIEIGEVIKEVNSIEITYVGNLSKQLSKVNPGDTVQITTDKNTYNIKTARNPENESKAYLGAYLRQSTNIKPRIFEKYGTFMPNAFFWFAELIMFLFILNLGIGLFNLLPIGPLDGGRMLHVALLKYFKKEKAMLIFSNVSLFLLLVVLLNIFVPIIRNIASNLF